MSRHEPRVKDETFFIFNPGTNGDRREDERELFRRHGLNQEGVVDRGDVEANAFLHRPNEGFLGELDVADSLAGDGQILSWTSNILAYHGF